MNQSLLNLLRLNFSAFEQSWFLKYSHQLLNEARIWQWKKDVLHFVINWFSGEKSMPVTTSGSTGEPKKISLSKKHMETSAKMTLDFFGLKPGDKALLCLPEKYIAGKMMLVRSVVGKLDLYCIEPSLAPIAELTEIDFAAMTPAQVSALLESAEGIHFLNTIKILILGGSFLSEKLEQKIKQLKTSVWHTYGMTETITHIALRKVNGEDASQWFTPLPGVEIQLGKDACLKINSSQLGVYNLQTNDKVEISKEGFQILGRKDNVVNSGGVKLFPEQIEKKLKGIIDGNFFLTGIQDDKFGEKLVIIIENKNEPKLHKNQLWKLMKAILSGYEMPKEIIFIDEIKTTTSGKIIRDF